MRNGVFGLWNGRGFTFTELLLVLTITFTLFAAVLVVGRNYTEKQMIERALVQLNLDLNALQSHAFGEGATTKLEFVSNGTAYIGLGHSRRLLFRRALPDGFRLSADSPLKEVTYIQTGTVDKFGAMQFLSHSGEVITVRLQFGKGRVILPEF